MKAWQFFCLLAAIVLAPHMPEGHSKIAGWLYFGAAAILVWRGE